MCEPAVRVRVRVRARARARVRVRVRVRCVNLRRLQAQLVLRSAMLVGHDDARMK